MALSQIVDRQLRRIAPILGQAFLSANFSKISARRISAHWFEPPTLAQTVAKT